jgi:glycine/D-amino acid oxidase-like deaminating enzyme
VQSICPSPPPQQVTSIATSSSSSSGETANKLLAIVASQDGQQQQQQHEADCVIIAAGVGTADLACQQGYQLPLLHKPAAIVITQPIQPVDLIRHMIVTHTGVFILQVSHSLTGWLRNKR